MNKLTKNNRINETKYNNQGDLMVIIEYNNVHDIKVQFQDDYKAIVKSHYNSFKNGKIANPYHKTFFNIGYMGENYKTNRKILRCWSDMLRRCYDDKSRISQQHLSYKDCQVCDEWLCFANFEKWYTKNYYQIDNELMCLDKDLYKSNIYSPNTCVFIPQTINKLLIKRKLQRGNKPIGITKTKYGYVARCNINNKKVSLGTFKTKEEAFLKYKSAKEKYIKKIADEYKNKIPQHIYELLYNYKIEIDD